MPTELDALIGAAIDRETANVDAVFEANIYELTEQEFKYDQ